MASVRPRDQGSLALRGRARQGSGAVARPLSLPRVSPVRGAFHHHPRLIGEPPALPGQAFLPIHARNGRRSATGGLILRRSGAAASAPPPGYSIPSGPSASPLRNWRTNGLSDSKSSSAGPASTIRPFQSTEM